ncbi:MAG: glycosyltransferase family 39 protein [Nanoarchaeota archaeon]
MRWNVWRVLLAVLVFGVFVFRLYLAFHTSVFSYDAYFHLRQVQAIADTGKPLFEDPFSYPGRMYLFAPLFYYVLAFFAKHLGLEAAAKVIPNLFFSLIPIVVYWISLKLTQKEWAALVTAFFTALIPQSYAYLINVNPLSLAIPLGLLMLYFLLDFDKRSNIYLAILFALLLTLTHATVFLFVLGLAFYFSLLSLLKLPKNPKESEFALFLFFLACWFSFLLYKKAFLTQGLFFLWQNIPLLLRSEAFGQATFFSALYAVNFIPLLFGLYSIYHALTLREHSHLFLFVSLVLGVFTLLFFGLIQVSTGLLFLGYFVVILSGHSLVLFARYMKKTRFPKLSIAFLILFLLLFILTTLLPMTVTANNHLRDTPASDQIVAFDWLSNHAFPESTILASVKEGQALTYYTHRKNLIDTSLFMMQDIEQRYTDLVEIFTSPFETPVLEKLKKYHVNYIYLSNESKKAYPIQPLRFSDENCFRLLYNQSVQIYGVTCL